MFPSWLKKTDFEGIGIAMARVLYDGLVEYEDGTPATTSQMAKDVVEFLNWAAEPEMDVRKQMGIKTVVIASALFALSIWVKRYNFFHFFFSLFSYPFFLLSRLPRTIANQ